MTDLEAQVAAEAKQITEAPKIPLTQLQPKSSGMAGRCHWCGRFSDDLVAVHDYGPVTPQGTSAVINERYKGRECCGGRHA